MVGQPGLVAKAFGKAFIAAALSTIRKTAALRGISASAANKEQTPLLSEIQMPLDSNSLYIPFKLDLL